MTSSTSTFKELPAPWTIKGPKAWWMLTSLGFPTWSSPAKLSDEHFYNSESNKDPFQGGTGMVQILRYSDTPAGPYDELLIIPGRFQNPQDVTKAIQEQASLRITRIYVSNLATTYAGRRNWNIPKSLARFEFEDIAPGQTQVKVYARTPNSVVDFEERPFFSARMRTPSWSPQVPFDAGRLPMSLKLVQPPLPSSSQAQQDAEVGTDEWMVLEPRFKGPIKLTQFTAGLEGGAMGDGVRFPNVDPYSWGIEFAGFEGHFDDSLRLGDSGGQSEAQ